MNTTCSIFFKYVTNKRSILTRNMILYEYFLYYFKETGKKNILTQYNSKSDLNYICNIIYDNVRQVNFSIFNENNENENLYLLKYYMFFSKI